MGVLKSILLLFKKNKTIVTTHPGDVSSYKDFALRNIQKLRVKGPICKNDLRKIVDVAKTFGKLKVINLLDASEIFEISDKQFKNCDSLEDISLPQTVIRIGESAFESCRSLTNITFPLSLQIISKSAFYGCSSLESIFIPKEVRFIGNWAFTCSNLKSIKVDSQNNNFKDNNDILFSHNEEILIKYPNRKNDKSYDIPKSVHTIACAAFQDTGNLKYVELPESLKQIGDHSFFNSSIKEINIPKGTETIGKMAFSHCSSLEKVVLPGSINKLGDRAFTECHRLTCVEIENGITGIGDNVFANCNSIKNISLPQSAYTVKD